MKKALIALAMIVSFTIPAATAHAYPISFGPLSQSLIEQIGCAWPPEPQARCRYGYRWDPDRHGGGSFQSRSVGAGPAAMPRAWRCSANMA